MNPLFAQKYRWPLTIITLTLIVILIPRLDLYQMLTIGFCTAIGTQLYTMKMVRAGFVGLAWLVVIIVLTGEPFMYLMISTVGLGIGVLYSVIINRHPIFKDLNW